MRTLEQAIGDTSDKPPEPTGNAAVTELLRRSFCADTAGDHDQAHALLDEAIELDPDAVVDILIADDPSPERRRSIEQSIAWRTDCKERDAREALAARCGWYRKFLTRAAR